MDKVHIFKKYARDKCQNCIIQCNDDVRHILLYFLNKESAFKTLSKELILKGPFGFLNYFFVHPTHSFIHCLKSKRIHHFLLAGMQENLVTLIMEMDFIGENLNTTCKNTA